MHTHLTNPSMADLAPYFPEYQLTGLLGMGGMGAVYKAYQPSFGRTVAIKILHASTVTNTEFLRLFQSEAQSMAVLEHPYLLKVYDSGEAMGMPFIVMEFVNGTCLHDAIAGQPVEPLQTAEITMRVCEGLSHAHNANILHRDIKPENILLDENCHPKIADFGLARDTHNPDQDKMIWGSPGFVAPEVTCNPTAVDHRSDLYAVGCMMYNMLTGLTPDPYNLRFDTLYWCDQRLVYILSKALQPDQNLRFQDADEMASFLNEVILTLENDQSTGALAPPPITEPSHQSPPH